MNVGFIYGALTGAGSLALAQNLGDYRIDDIFLEYVFNPLAHAVMHLLGKNTVSLLEQKGKVVANDTFAKLTNLINSGEADAAKVIAEVKKIAGEVKTAL